MQEEVKMIFMYIPDNIWANIDAGITILTLGLVFYSWYQSFKQNKQIKIFIIDNGQTIELPIKLLRRNFTRAELFGILGAFEKDSKFNIEYTSTIDFFENIENIQNAKSNEITIIITEKDKFDRVNI